MRQYCKISSLLCLLLGILLSVPHGYRAKVYAAEPTATGGTIELTGANYILAEEVAPERLSVYLTSGPVTALYLEGEASGRPYRYRSDALTPEAITGTYDAVQKRWRIDRPTTGCGYFVLQEGSLPRYVYLIDYSLHRLDFTQWEATPLPEDPCSRVRLTLQTPLHLMRYYTPSGSPRVLPHKVILSRENQLWEPNRRQFKTYTEQIEIPLISEQTELQASLSDTPYTVETDVWAQALDIKFSYPVSSTIETRRLEVHSGVDIDSKVEEIDWQRISAPSTLRMWAVGNEPSAAKYQWRIEKLEGNNSNLMLSYAGRETEYTFAQSGQYRITLECLNRDASCIDNSFEQILHITESTLEVPNAFTPGVSLGINDEFKVLHRSLVEFHARIYSSTGQELYSWTDPNAGWNGYYRGSLVPTGSYYYAIDARGADGIRYEKRGVVNVLRSELDTF